MKAVLLSDTHEKHTQLKVPDGDLLIVAGDFTFTGHTQAVKKFADWLEKLPHEHKVLIPGNHELNFSRSRKANKAKDYLCSRTGVTYLENSSVQIENFKIWGSPMTPRFFDWEFNVDRGIPIRRYWDLIPPDTNILVTHGPPMGILDINPQGNHCGCEELAAKIEGLSQLKLHVFGHIHHPGSQIIKQNNITFVNASVVNERYQIWSDRPIVTIDI